MPAPERRLRGAPVGRRPRDSRRSSVYKAERATGDGLQFRSRAETLRYLRQVEQSAWFRERYPDWKPLDLRYKTTTQAPFASIKTRDIVIPTPAVYRTRQVILHEIAHFAQARGTPWHGHTFARVLLELTAEFAPPTYAPRLERNLREHGLDPDQGIPAGEVQP